MLQTPQVLLPFIQSGAKVRSTEIMANIVSS